MTNKITKERVEAIRNLKAEKKILREEVFSSIADLANAKVLLKKTGLTTEQIDERINELRELLEKKPSMRRVKVGRNRRRLCKLYDAPGYWKKCEGIWYEETRFEEEHDEVYQLIYSKSVKKYWDNEIKEWLEDYGEDYDVSTPEELWKNENAQMSFDDSYEYLNDFCMDSEFYAGGRFIPSAYIYRIA